LVSEHRTNGMSFVNQRITASLRNLFIGDTLSMPVHWFYRTSDIYRYFPANGIRKMEAAPADHPSSIMSLHSTEAGGRKSAKRSQSNATQQHSQNTVLLEGEVVGDIILKGKRELWGGSSTHYHHGLQAGDNTLNAYCARLMIQHVIANEGYSKEQWIADYIEFMTAEPARHPDTYAESYHRGFFANLKAGKAPEDCGAVTHDTPSMGALVTVAPMAFALFKQHTLEQTQLMCREHVNLTHPDKSLLEVVSTYVDLLYKLVHSGEQSQSTIDLLHQSGKVISGTNIQKLLQLKSGDAAVLGGRYSTACYITDSWPSVCYLAAKYHDEPENALLVNTNLGGENAHRGSVLGTIVGAASALQNQAQFEQLLYQEAIEEQIQEFIGMFGQTEP